MRARKKEPHPLPGLADAALEVLEALDVGNPVLLGWSLGGHVAIEMASRQQNFRGLFVTGTPPVGENISEGFSRKPPEGPCSDIGLFRKSRQPGLRIGCSAVRQHLSWCKRRQELTAIFEPHCSPKRVSQKRATSARW